MDMPIEPASAKFSQAGGYLEGNASTVDEDRKVHLGMTFYIGNDIILAIFFIGSYIFLRGYDTNLRWFPPGVGFPPYFAAFWIMIGAVAGAVAMVAGDWALNHDRYALFRVLIVIALLFFLADLAAQVYVMGRLPFTVQSGAFATSYIVLSGYHVYHMALGIFLGLGLVVRAFRGLYLPAFERRAIASTPNAVTGLRRNAATAGPVRENEATAGVDHLRNTTAPRVLSYYYIWASVYAILFWLLVIIQPPYHP